MNRINLKYLSYTTRPFIFTCKFADLIKRLSDKSSYFDEYNQLSMTEEFLKSYLNSEELTPLRNVYTYKFKKNDQNTSKIKIAKKSEHVLFLLKTDNYLENLLKISLGTLIKSFNEILSFLEKNDKFLSHIIGLRKDEFKSKISNMQIKCNEKLTAAELREEVLILSKLLKPVSIKIFKADTKSEIYRKCLDNLNQLHKVLDILDAFLLSEKRMQILALVSKAGTIQISIVFENEINCKYETNKKILKNPHLISEANRVSKIITSYINKLPKVFSILDINRFLGFEDKIAVYDHPRKMIRNLNILNASRCNNLYKKVSNQKAIFMRMIVDESEEGYSPESCLEFYNYLSLLVAYHHSYDENTLLKCYLKEEKRGLIDYLNKPTEHMYVDDSLVVLSTIDESANVAQIKKLVGRGGEITTDVNSHQLRIYSFWDFIYICNALALGSTAILIDTLLLDYIKRKISDIKFKQAVHIKQARLGRVLSRINSFYNNRSLSIKVDSNYISDILFEKMGLKRIEKQVNETTDINWRSANLMSSQSYNRYSLLLTFISLFISVASFGLVAKVAKGCTSDHYSGLMYSLFTDSPKILVILTIISIPIAIYACILVYEIIRAFVFTKNVAKLDGFRIIRGKKIQKNQEKL